MLLTGFRFAVDIGSKRIGAFIECTLPTIQWDTQKIEEGGINTFAHHLPTRRKEATITLKRGLGLGRELTDWYRSMLLGVYMPQTVTIHMMDSLRHDVISWSVADAFPTKWVGPTLNSKESAVAIETLELSCGEITVAYADEHFPKSWEWSAPPTADEKKSPTGS